MADLPEFPEAYFCPISSELMEDPVFDQEGNTYDRKSIVEWLSKNGTSPFTRNPLDANRLVPNNALRNAIKELKAQYEEAGKPLPKRTASVQELEQQVMNDEGKEESAAASSGEVVPGVPTLRAETSIAGNELIAHIAIDPPLGTGERVPTDVCVVIDVSGSMSTEASIKDASGANLEFGLSVLDVVKHAVRTIIASLTAQDRLSIVAYSTDAHEIMGLTDMNEAGRQEAETALRKLRASGQTNLWGGLEMGLKILDNNIRPGALCTVMLLTDGLPNVQPPQPHTTMLKSFRQKHPRRHAIIHTFGFGYMLDTILLEELAIEGNGMYIFIPDSSFVGTAFVNAISNVLTTYATDLYMELQPRPGVTFVRNTGTVGLGVIEHKGASGIGFSLSTLHYGQSRNVVVRVVMPPEYLKVETPFLDVSLKYVTARSEDNVGQTVSLEGILTISEPRDIGELRAHGHRQQFAQLLHDACTMYDPKHKKQEVARKAVAEFVRKIPVDCREIGQQHNLSRGILQDAKGQVTEAFSKDEWFQKWGRHYTRSLARAHSMQQCHNFKDVGVQCYGGQLFQRLRDEAEEVFNKLPPPEPSDPQYGGGGGGGGAAKPLDMASFNNRDNPCVHAKCCVTLENGEQRRMDELRRGDRVKESVSGGVVEVDCIVRTETDGTARMVKLGGLLVTPFHPVRVEGCWQFPSSLNDAQTVTCDAVYSVLLKQGASILVEGVEVITLGHGVEDDRVAGHPYFANRNKVVADLSRMPNFDEGLISLRSGCLRRDPETGLVCELTQ